jgi:steroid delta-isomerase-like uncharacterized protein
MRRFHMSTEQNKAVVRKWFEDVISRGKVEYVDTICQQCVPSFVVIKGVADPPPQGLEGVKDLIRAFRDAFPDLKISVEDQIAEDDKVVSQLTVRGTHLGNFMGAPATGRQVEVSGISIWRVADGKLIDETVNWDTLRMLQQLGVVPTPG